MMGSWKIRTKIIAGLIVLAVVFFVLVGCSLYQVRRDRILTKEFELLSAEIKHTSDLYSWALRLRSATVRLSTSERIRKSNDTYEQVFGMRDEIENSLHNLELVHVQLQRTVQGSRELSELPNTAVLRVEQTQSLTRFGRELERYRPAYEDFERTADVFLGKSDGDEASFIAADEHAILMAIALELEQQAGKEVRLLTHGVNQFLAGMTQQQRNMRSSMAFIGGVALVLFVGIAWYYWNNIASPFNTLSVGAQTIADGQWSNQIILEHDDEIGRLANTVNDITGRFRQALEDLQLAKEQAEEEVRLRSRELIQNERLASVGFLAAGVAHEVNNPMGIIAFSAEIMETHLEDLPEEQLKQFDPAFLGELSETLETIQSEAFRVKGITKRLLNFAQLGDSSRSDVDLKELVSNVVSMVTKVGQYRCKTITVHADQPVLAHCNSQEIQQVLLNLISNALESVDNEGKVDVTVRYDRDPLTGVRSAMVSVDDDGCGMDAEVINHLFEPFFTRKRDNSGTGLGLSISYRIVSMHHGSLTPFSEGEGKGSKMILRLPAAADQQQPVLTIGNKADSKSLEWNDVRKAA